jgi:hypothetical protein
MSWTDTFGVAFLEPILINLWKIYYNYYQFLTFTLRVKI